MDDFVEEIIQKDINFKILSRNASTKKDYLKLSNNLHFIEKIILDILERYNSHKDILCVELILYLSFLYNVYEHKEIVYPSELPNSFPCYLAEKAEFSANRLKRKYNSGKYDRLVAYFSNCDKPTF